MEYPSNHAHEKGNASLVHFLCRVCRIPTPSFIGVNPGRLGVATPDFRHGGREGVVDGS